MQIPSWDAIPYVIGGAWALVVVYALGLTVGIRHYDRMRAWKDGQQAKERETFWAFHKEQQDRWHAERERLLAQLKGREE